MIRHHGQVRQSNGKFLTKQSLRCLPHGQGTTNHLTEGVFAEISCRKPHGRVANFGRGPSLGDGDHLRVSLMLCEDAHSTGTYEGECFLDVSWIRTGIPSNTALSPRNVFRKRKHGLAILLTRQVKWTEPEFFNGKEVALGTKRSRKLVILLGKVGGLPKKKAKQQKLTYDSRVNIAPRIWWQYKSKVYSPIDSTYIELSKINILIFYIYKYILYFIYFQLRSQYIWSKNKIQFF